MQDGADSVERVGLAQPAIGIPRKRRRQRFILQEAQARGRKFIRSIGNEKMDAMNNAEAGSSHRG